MDNFLFRAFNPKDNNLVERWVTRKEAERLRRLHEKAGWTVTIKEVTVN